MLLLLAAPRAPGADLPAGPWITPAVLEVGEQARLSLMPSEPGVAVSLENVNTGETGTFEISPSGEVQGDPQALAHFFRCKRSGRARAMDPGVLAILAGLAADYPGRTIEIISGYRKPGFGVKHSKHYSGRAIDLRVRGVPTARVRRQLWQEHDEIGIGYYHQQGYLHIDHRPADEKAGWAQGSRGRSYRNQPWWAK